MNKCPSIAIRVDASRQIGGGHVMRCLTLARALTARGARCAFVSRQMAGDLRSAVSEAGFALQALSSATTPFAGRSDDVIHAPWAEVTWEQDADETAIALREIYGTGFDWLIYDHYAFDSRWVSAVRAQVPFDRVMAIDDIDDRPLGADVLLDQSRLPPFGPRRHCAAADLIGPDFALLRPEFREQRKASLVRRSRPRQGRLRVLVSTGMMDIEGASLTVIESLMPLEAEVDVAVSARASSAAALRDAAARFERVQLHFDAPNMAELMVNADLAIGSAGATTWERLCLGLPSILLVLAENQKTIAEGLGRNKLSLVIGGLDSRTRSRLRAEASRLLADEAALQAMSFRCSDVCDGLGVDRVVSALLG